MSVDPISIRQALDQDLPDILDIQAASPGASQWRAEDYLAYDVRVAICDDAIGGFVAIRHISGHEWEILNLAVRPELRRRGIARRLIEDCKLRNQGVLHLEVRESNSPARNLYKQLHFVEVGQRPGYYYDPLESAVVMTWDS